MINYTVIDGAIPEGCRILSDKGVMRVDGVAPLDPSFYPPVFSGPSVYPIMDEFSQVDIELDVAAQNGKALVGGTVIRGLMPWGLMLDGYTISGEVSELNVKVPVDFSPEDAPKWISREGSLGIFNELESISPITLQTQIPTNFRIVKGEMAWGLLMSTSGIISGKIVELNGGGEVEPIGPGPIFDTARGSIGIVDEQQVITDGEITIQATPRTGSSITFTVSKGQLPWGVLMNTNGHIVGTVADIINGGNESDDPDQRFKPKITSATVNAQIGTPLSHTVTVTIPSDRTLLSLRVSSGKMPFGLLLQGTNINGTPTGAPGTYTFELTATDSKYVNSLPTIYTFEVSS